MDLALGEVGLNKVAVLRMTWGDLWRAIYGYWIREDREWDRTRNVMTAIHNKNRGKRPAKRPKQLMKLAIDKMRMGRYEWTQEDTENYERGLVAWGLKDTKDVQKRNSQD